MRYGRGRLQPGPGYRCPPVAGCRSSQAPMPCRGRGLVACVLCRTGERKAPGGVSAPASDSCPESCARAGRTSRAMAPVSSAGGNLPLRGRTLVRPKHDLPAGFRERPSERKCPASGCPGRRHTGSGWPRSASAEPRTSIQTHPAVSDGAGPILSAGMRPPCP